MNDPHHLQRFVDAQNPVYDNVRNELRRGKKSSHWMWFIFPQLRGLGSSPMAERYAIASLEEAAAYLQHPILGPRLVECTELVNLVPDKSLEQILGYPDHLKFKSCMTLFAHVTPPNPIFMDALKKYCNGEFDPQTLP